MKAIEHNLQNKLSQPEICTMYAVCDQSQYIYHYKYAMLWQQKSWTRPCNHKPETS